MYLWESPAPLAWYPCHNQSALVTNWPLPSAHTLEGKAQHGTLCTEQHSWPMARYPTRYLGHTLTCSCPKPAQHQHQHRSPWMTIAAAHGTDTTAAGPLSHGCILTPGLCLHEIHIAADSTQHMHDLQLMLDMGIHPCKHSMLSGIPILQAVEAQTQLCCHYCTPNAFTSSLQG